MEVGLGLAVEEPGDTGKTDEEELFKGIFPPKSTRVIKIEVVGGRGNEERTLDEFAVLTENKENILPTVPSRRGPPTNSKASEEDTHTPSPDITTILPHKFLQVPQFKVHT
jgi:hypothetical protein